MTGISSITRTAFLLWVMIGGMTGCGCKADPHRQKSPAVPSSVEAYWAADLVFQYDGEEFQRAVSIGWMEVSIVPGRKNSYWVMRSGTELPYDAEYNPIGLGGLMYRKSAKVPDSVRIDLTGTAPALASYGTDGVEWPPAFVLYAHRRPDGSYGLMRIGPCFADREKILSTARPHFRELPLRERLDWYTYMAHISNDHCGDWDVDELFRECLDDNLKMYGDLDWTDITWMMQSLDPTYMNGKDVRKGLAKGSDQYSIPYKGCSEVSGTLTIYREPDKIRYVIRCSERHFSGDRSDWVERDVDERVFPRRTDPLVARAAEKARALNLNGVFVRNPDVDHGGRVVFESERFGKSAIMVMRADGTGHRRLTEGDGQYYWPRWDPRGERILFGKGTWYGYGSVTHVQLFVMNADGSGQTPLLGPEIRVERAAWSPDGKRIAYVRWGDPTERGVWIMDSDGSGSRRIHPETTGELTWVSPDRLRFHRHEESNQGTCVMNIDGTGLECRPLRFKGYEPAWSPDGRRVGYQEYVYYGAVLRVWDEEKGTTTCLTCETKIEKVDGLAWSPAGDRLYFTSEGDLYSIDTNGEKDLKRLTVKEEYYDTRMWRKLTELPR